MFPGESLILFIFLNTCVLSTAHSEYIFSWPYYQDFVSDWTLKQGSTAVKTAAKPSDAVATLTFLDQGRTEHSGYVWGLWDYGTGNGKLSYKLNLTRYTSLFCGITSASFRIKYYSEGPNQGKVLQCTETGSNNPCGLPHTDASMDWGDVSKPIRISDKILEFEFNTKDGKNLIIDEVALIYNLNENDPACQQKPPPPPPPGKLEQILNQINQFQQGFQQAFSFFNIFGRKNEKINYR